MNYFQRKYQQLKSFFVPSARPINPQGRRMIGPADVTASTTTWQRIQSVFRGSTPVQTKAPGNQIAPTFPIAKIQLDRIRFDVSMWRSALKEAENEWYPQRVKMQRMYLDTILNAHVKACIRRRKTLTLQRQFKICDDAGNEVEEVTKILKATWFRLFQSYALDGLLHGYNLISLGDIVNDAFPNIRFIKRQNVSPDRRVVGNFLYSISGTPFSEPPYSDWNIYVSTPDETGASPCGYGLLYEIAITEIMLRNNIGQNADYNEMFGIPIRKGTTSKTGDERNQFEAALQGMASNAYILLQDGVDDLDLVESSSRGSAYMTYANFEERCEKKISKVLLGHADALDSVPGKLGAGTGEDNPVESALMGVQSEDAEFLQPIINNELLPRMRKLGFNIPEGLHFEYINDDEKEQFRQREDESNKKTADILKVINDSGGDLTDETWEWFEERTGIPGVKKTEPPPPPVLPGLPPMNGNGKEKANGKPNPFEKAKPNGVSVNEDDEEIE